MRSLVLTLTFWVSGVSAFAQDIKVTVPRNQCEIAKGSKRASDYLQTLKALPPNSPGRDEAVAACDSKVQSLKKQEDDKWNRALQARTAGQCVVAKGLFEELAAAAYGTAYQREAGDQLHTLNCATAAGAADSATNVCADAPLNLRNAQGAFRVGYFTQAKGFAAAAQSCPSTADEAKKVIEEIDRTEKSRKLAEQAKLALLKKDHDSACKLILQIDSSYPDLKDLKRQAGECAAPPPIPERLVVDNGRGQRSLPPSDPLLAEYNRALGLIKSKPGEAERILQKLYAADKNYKDIDSLLKEVRDDLQNKDFAELEKQARSYLDKGDLQAALGKIDRTITLRPNESRLRDFKNLVLERLGNESSELSSGINTYYRGNYPEARKLLTTFLNNPHSPRLLAFARFYAGAAWVSEYYLTGQSDSAKKDEAKKAFSIVLKDSPQFSPDWTKVSPKIRPLFLEAAGKPGQK
jgi:hypothetical protein